MIGLESLLTALRGAGLKIGVTELARLQRVFALAPQFGDSRLRGVLRAILVKSAEDSAVFDSLFKAWLDQADSEVRRRAVRPTRPDRQEDLPGRRPRGRRLFLQTIGFIVLLLLSLPLPLSERVGRGVDPRRSDRPPQATPTPAPQAPEAPRDNSPDESSEGKFFQRPLIEEVARTPADLRNRSFRAWVPTLIVTPAAWDGRLPLGLGSVALAAAVALWRTRHQLRGVPEPTPELVRRGPPRIFPSPPQLVESQLLEQREEDALVWGIGHFVAEEPTRQLNLSSTVRATAEMAGIPHLYFHQVRYPREVWLWIDEAADDPTIQRIADEVASALAAHGLPVERALFRGIPDWLVNAAGQAFAPSEVDERRDAARVAILSDGRVLTRQYTANHKRVGLEALLRSLSFWPRLAFVDFSSEPGILGTLLTRHSIERIAPMELADFLSRDDDLQRRAAVLDEGSAVWAAACALSPSSVDELRAFELRRRLDLRTSPWAIRVLRAEAPGSPGRLHWKAPDRARRLNWLRDAEAQPPGSLSPSSFLGQALAFWEEVYDREIRKQTDGEAGGPWQETPACQHLRMERALLALWCDCYVTGAVRKLYSLHAGSLRDVIAGHLGHLAPIDWGGEEHIHLPWTWASRPPLEQVLLQGMGFGGGMPAVKLRRPARFWVGMGICLGLASGAFGIAALGGPRRPALVNGPGKPDITFENLTKLPTGSWGVTVATRKTLAAQEVPSAVRIDVRWEEKNLPCVAALGDHRHAEVWNCGKAAPPSIRFSEEIGRRVVALAIQPGTADAEALAVDLLDSGSADVVLLSSDWRQSAKLLTGFSLEDQELLVLAPDSDWKSLSKSLRFNDIKPLREVWPEARLLAEDPNASLRGLGSCRDGETLEEHGMVFVRICPRTFTMGSPEDDDEAERDERPAHSVTLNEYWIGQMEVTEGQYQEGGGSTLPATQVQWGEADAFCRRHGWRLPTEAEWENAARAGAGPSARWPFADEALQDFAWFQGNSRNRPHLVGTRKPNRWGIYDMHGNVWEWVAGWYVPYTPDPQDDTIEIPDGRRVLRGGAFDLEPRSLRSAERVRNESVIRQKSFGFRCARDADQQP